MNIRQRNTLKDTTRRSTDLRLDTFLIVPSFHANKLHRTQLQNKHEGILAKMKII